MTVEYYTERLKLKVLDESYADRVLEYFMRNKDFLEEWEAVKPDEFYTLETHISQLNSDLKDIEEKRTLRLWVFKKEDAEESRVLGTVSFSNIVWGAFLSCFLGYKLDKDEINKGYITEAIKKGIDVMFNEYGLHRIEANIMPKNVRSLKVVEKLGFENEGISHKYLRINGKWEDHFHMVLRNGQLE